MGFLQKVIRNDAMKTDPHEIYNWRVFALACAVSKDIREISNLLTFRQACFGGTLFGMDIGIIGGVITMPSFKESVGTNLWKPSLITHTANTASQNYQS